MARKLSKKNAASAALIDDLPDNEVSERISGLLEYDPPRRNRKPKRTNGTDPGRGYPHQQRG